MSRNPAFSADAEPPAASVARSAGAAIVAELRFLWRTFAAGGTRAFVVTAGLFALFVIVSWLGGDIQAATAGDVVALLIAGIVYALYIGAVAGIIGGLVWVGWKTVGAWLLLPVGLTPLTIWLAIWLLSGFLEAQAADVGAAVVAAGAAHDWLVMSLGPAARIGPPIIVIALPLLLADLGLVLLQPEVLWEFFILAVDVGVVAALGILPALGISAVVLPVAYVRRYRRRAAAASD